MSLKIADIIHVVFNENFIALVLVIIYFPETFTDVFGHDVRDT